MKIILAITLLALSGLASAEIQTYYSDGSSSKTFGDTTYFSNGSSATRHGDTVYYSDGRTSTTFGN